eukprot:765194-Hanusia_phi.AAC.2
MILGWGLWISNWESDFGVANGPTAAIGIVARSKDFLKSIALRNGDNGLTWVVGSSCCVYTDSRQKLRIMTAIETD